MKIQSANFIVLFFLRGSFTAILTDYFGSKIAEKTIKLTDCSNSFERTFHNFTSLIVVPDKNMQYTKVSCRFDPGACAFGISGPGQLSASGGSGRSRIRVPGSFSWSAGRADGSGNRQGFKRVDSAPDLRRTAQRQPVDIYVRPASGAQTPALPGVRACGQTGSNGAALSGEGMMRFARYRSSQMADRLVDSKTGVINPVSSWLSKNCLAIPDANELLPRPLYPKIIFFFLKKLSGVL